MIREIDMLLRSGFYDQVISLLEAKKGNKQFSMYYLKLSEAYAGLGDFEAIKKIYHSYLENCPLSLRVKKNSSQIVSTFLPPANKNLSIRLLLNALYFENANVDTIFPRLSDLIENQNGFYKFTYNTPSLAALETQVKNSVSNKRFLLYTDSRGIFKHRKFLGNIFSEKLYENFTFDVFSQPHKWATLIDFFDLVAKGIFSPKEYDLIFVFAGIVDFSPRHSKQLTDHLYGDASENLMHITANKKYLYQRKINNKKPVLDMLFGADYMEKHMASTFKIYFEGEPTNNLYGLDVLDKVAEKLNEYENLIWISCCDILQDWDGDFVRGRPRNIKLSECYSRYLVNKVHKVIDLHSWNAKDIKAYTNDNMHLTEEGSSVLYKKILIEINERFTPNKRELSLPYNVIVTAADSQFFPSLIKLLQSIFKYGSAYIDKILVFDVGLSSSQLTLINSLKNVDIFSYRQEDKLVLDNLRFDFYAPKTYGFKAYALKHCQYFLPEQKLRNSNVLYVDSGIELTKSIKRIFDIINREQIFCVDHADCHDYYGDGRFMLLHILSPKLFGQGVNNIKFELPSYEALTKYYIKAGFFGYKIDGKHQTIIDKHYQLSISTSVLDLPKTKREKEEWMWYRNNTEVGKYLISNNIPFTNLDYQGGRQDQTSLSYVIATSDVKIYNSKEFNYTQSGTFTKLRWFQGMSKSLLSKYDLFEQSISEYLKSKRVTTSNSKAKNIENYLLHKWDEFESAGQVTQAIELPESKNAKKSMTILHRNSSLNSDLFKEAGGLLNFLNNQRDDVFVLMGNGPSLRDIDFALLKNHHTFGLNAAYRAYSRIGFYPKYFGCFDARVCSHHKPYFEELVLNSPIEKFFFINFDEQKKDIFTDPRIFSHPKFQKINFITRTPEEKARKDIIALSFDPFYDMLTSGSNAIQCGILMGYRKFVLLGCDANYTEVVDGAKQESVKWKLVMEKTPRKNPNYWFDDYQVKGDVFNLPNLAGTQMPAWIRLADTIKYLSLNVEIINCSPISKIEVFKKMPLNDALKYFEY